MKKILFLSLLPLILPNIFSCNKNINKINTLFGVENPNKCVNEINSLNDFNSMVANKETFILVQYTKNCSFCQNFINNCVTKYAIDNKLVLYKVEYDVVKNDQHGYIFNLGGSTVHFFLKGNELKNLELTDNSKDLFSDYESFKEYMDEHVAPPSIFYINTKSELDMIFKIYNKYAIYYGKTGCIECNYLRTHSLVDYGQKNMNMKKMYFLDFKDFSEEEFNTTRKEYGIAESASNIWGYGSNGALPTIHYIEKKTNPIDSIKQAFVYGNDILDDNYKVINTFYNEERVKNIEYSKVNSMIGKTYSKNEVSNNTLNDETNEKVYSSIFNDFMDYLQNIL